MYICVCVYIYYYIICIFRAQATSRKLFCAFEVKWCDALVNNKQQ